MTIQFLFIFVNKEQLKDQKKLNTREKMLILNEKFKGMTFSKHELPRCGICSFSAPDCESSWVPMFCSQPSNNFGRSELKQAGIM